MAVTKYTRNYNFTSFQTSNPSTPLPADEVDGELNETLPTAGGEVMSASLKTALALAERGFRVFPLVPNGKTPAIKKWPERATTDPDKIEAMWRDSLFGMDQGYGVGIATGQGLFVVDVDVKKGGYDGLTQIERDHGRFPEEAPRVRTPSGGLHIYLRSDPGDNIPNSVEKLAPGVDIRGDRGFVVGPGTSIDGVEYRETERGTGQ